VTELLSETPMRYAELLFQLKETLDFCASFSLADAVHASRFNKYQERIQRLCEIIQTYPVDQLPAELKPSSRKKT
jgi:hypothetical protein